MIRFLKQIIKAIAARWGVVMFKRSTGIYIGEGETPTIAVRLCGTTRPMIVDGGAHEGTFVDAVRAIYPQACFVCVEPDPTLARILRERFIGDGSVCVMEMALGEASGSARLNLNASRACNSLVAASQANTGILGAMMDTTAQVDVRVATLDELLEEAAIDHCDIVKLDLQAYDLHALRGARRTLKSAKVVIVEVWYAPVYAGTVNYLDICTFMQERGFELYTLVGLHYSTTDRLLWSDAIFVRNDSDALAQSLAIG